MLETIIHILGKARGAVAALFSDLPAGPGQGVFSIARKELSAYFSSPAAFIFIGVFLAALLFIFFWVDRFFARNIADVRPLFEWMPILLIFLVSAMTMRMWSEERRAGTLEFLLTAPVHTLDLVIGKFLACLALVGITLALTLPLPVTVAILGSPRLGPGGGRLYRDPGARLGLYLHRAFRQLADRQPDREPHRHVADLRGVLRGGLGFADLAVRQ